MPPRVPSSRVSRASSSSAPYTAPPVEQTSAEGTFSKPSWDLEASWVRLRDKENKTFFAVKNEDHETFMNQ